MPDWKVVISAGIVGLALVAVAVFSFAPIEHSITGYFALPSQETHVSIIGSENAEISRFEFDQTITIGESINTSVELANTGSFPLSSDFRVEVFNSNNTLIYTYPGKEATIPPGGFHKQTIKHTPHELGTYILRLAATIGEDSFQSTKFLSVNEEPPPPELEPLIITRREIEWEREPAPPPPTTPTEPDPTPQWRVDAPAEVTVAQGRSTTAAITIENTGNAVLRNIRTSLQNSNNLSVRVNPQIIFNLLANETKRFILEISAENRTLTGQTIDYRISSSRLTESGQIGVDVVPVLTLRQLDQRITDLEAVIAGAEAELRTAERSGLTVDTATTHLEDARGSLDEARTNIGEGEIEATRQSLEQVERSLDRFYTALFKARSDDVEVRAYLIKPAYIFVMVAVIVAALLIGIYYYLREKQTQRPKLLREAG